MLKLNVDYSKKVVCIFLLLFSVTLQKFTEKVE